MASGGTPACPNSPAHLLFHLLLRDSNARGYAWEAGGSKQVVYVSNHGHIHELYVTLNGT
jgi:hypothetical protein